MFLARTPPGAGPTAPIGYAISPATNAIQTVLITPSANSAAMRAQQHPTHQAPWFAPMRSAPDKPGRQEASKNPSGLRQCLRQTVMQARGDFAEYL
jgi:hypothetical protein